MNHLTTSRAQKPSILLFDKYFLLTLFAIMAIGLIMVTSASMAVAERQYHQPFYYLFRQGFYLILGLLIASILLRIRMQFWHRIGGALLLIGIFLLILVLVPGVGRSVNGSMRWIGVGSFGLQVSEFMKLAFIIYLASYLVRRHEEVRMQISGFVKPMILLGIIAVLLLMEPDFGATVVIAVTAMSMMYFAGVRFWQFLALLACVALAFSVLAISSPYRLTRLTTFLNPWAHQFNAGYQLTQSLIAFGRGGLWGAGLGGSIQKLFYLPEAHTDFLFAVLAEELGLIGALVTVFLYVVLVIRTLLMGRRAQLAGQHKSAYMAYGFGIWIGIQALVNIGVNSGLLPTKGLTLPFMSYGGSSLLILFIAVAILLRIDYEARLSGLMASAKKSTHRRERYGF